MATTVPNGNDRLRKGKLRRRRRWNDCGVNVRFWKTVFQTTPTRRRHLLQHANQDQMNALSKLVLNLLKRRIPLTPPLMARLRRYKMLCVTWANGVIPPNVDGNCSWVKWDAVCGRVWRKPVNVSYRCENYKETTTATGGGQCIVMEEIIVLPKKELPEIVQWYKGELTSNALLNRARHFAAKKKRLLTDPGLEAAEAVQQTQPLSRALREATKRLRQLPGAEGSGGGGVVVDEEEEDENLVSAALEKWMKRMVQSGLKREPKTPRHPPPSPPPPPPTSRPALKRPVATSSSTVPPKKTTITTTKKPGPSKKQKKKSFMRGMLEKGLLAGYKSVDPTPRARRRLNPAEGWEDWAEGRKLRRPLAGNDYWTRRNSVAMGWISRNGSARLGASGIGQAISTWDPARIWRNAWNEGIRALIGWIGLPNSTTSITREPRPWRTSTWPIARWFAPSTTYPAARP